MNNNITFALRAPMHAIALATLIALVAWTIGLPSWIHTANAAVVEEFTDVITDSDIGAAAIHTLFFTTTNAMNAGESFRIYFDEVGGNFAFEGVQQTDLIASSTGFTAVNACAGAANEIDLSVGTDWIEGTVCAGDTVLAGLIGIQVGDANFVDNPGTTNSYVISLQGYGANPIADSGDTRVAIIDDVTVTATVDTIFTFSINGVRSGATVNNDVRTTFASSTATTVPFGIIAPGVSKVMAQELRVDTNALNGFSVTVFADQTLTAGNGATIDEFRDGSAIASSSVWAGPASILANLDSYGHWGLTSDDNVVSSSTPGLWGVGSNTAYVGNFVSNPIEVFYHNTAVSYAQGGMGVGSTTVAYKVEISNLQEAATDYRATLTYIATPVF